MKKKLHFKRKIIFISRKKIFELFQKKSFSNELKSSHILIPKVKAKTHIKPTS